MRCTMLLVVLTVCPLSGLGCTSESNSAADEPDPSATEEVSSTADIVVPTADAPTGDETETTETDITVEPPGPPRICNPGSRWKPGMTAFTNVTVASGLTAMGVTGFRLSAADVDGDGTADLTVRNHKPGQRDDFSDGGTRLTWLLRSKGDLTFEDITQVSGITTTRGGDQGRTTHVLVFGDVDNDGDLDAFAGVNAADLASDNGDRSEILLNDGAGYFELGPEDAAIRQVLKNWGTCSAAFTDVDLDGLLDVFVGYDVDHANAILMDRLYTGDGLGGFTDVTTSYGLATADWTDLASINSGKVHRRSWGATVCDVNNDGRPDLITSSYSRFFNGYWQSDGEGGWTDRSVASGIGSDQRADWSTNLNAQCYCQLTPGAPDCGGVPAPPDFFPCTNAAALRWNHDFDREPFRLGGNTFTTLCGDVDNDGDLDLMHLPIVHWDVGDSSDPAEVLLNPGGADPVFERPGAEALGMARDWQRTDWNAGDMTGAFLDFDNDGMQDIYIGSSDYPGTRGFLFQQDSVGKFVEVPPAEGIDHARSHGVAVADFDRDGDLDVAVGHSRSRCSGDPTCLPTQEVRVFRNEMGNGSNFVQIALRGGPGSNRFGIGARVSVTAGGKTQVQEVGGGHGHYGIQHGTVLHFGLAEACEITEILVRWPDAKHTTETFKNVSANYRITIKQGGKVDYVL